MKEEIKFRLGDSVYFPYHGYGTIIGLHNDGREYPIEVRWEASPHGQEVNTFTKDGFLTRNGAEGNVPPDSKLRDKLTVVDKSLLERGEKKVEDNTGEGLKVGDWVWLNHNEKGIITFIYPNKETCIVDSELDGEVEAVMAGLTKVEYSPINPSHYQAAGIPEAIDIMKHLMTQEQFKGFLWGNIIKYAYRYGRKGDEHDTAGKIEWYANRLKEVCAEEKKEQERE